jgi:hypothetical protein
MNARLLAALSVAFGLLAVAGFAAGTIFIARHGGGAVVLVPVVPLGVVSLLCAVYVRRARRRE